jgi:hypothetical protein
MQLAADRIHGADRSRFGCSGHLIEFMERQAVWARACSSQLLVEAAPHAEAQPAATAVAMADT